MGALGGCSYTPHNHHAIGWIFLTRQKKPFLIFVNFNPPIAFNCVFNHHQLPKGAFLHHNCFPWAILVPRTTTTLVAENVPCWSALGEKPKNIPVWPQSIPNVPKYSAWMSIPDIMQIYPYLCRAGTLQGIKKGFFSQENRFIRPKNACFWINLFSLIKGSNLYISARFTNLNQVLVKLRETLKKKLGKSGQADRFKVGGAPPAQPDRFYLWKF